MNNILKSILHPVPEKFQADYARLLSPLLPSPRTDTPYFIHMCGIPGAGKTTIARPLYDKHLKADGFHYVGFDDVMETLNGYTALSKQNPEKAFRKYAPTAANIGYHLINHAITNNISIIFDHGASPQSHIDLIKDLKTYKTSIIYLECALDEAIKRVKKREIQIKRHTPEAMIIERHEKINTQMTDYKNAADDFIPWTSHRSSDTAIQELYDRLKA